MDDIRRQDTRLFVQELFGFWRLVASFVAFFFLYGVAEPRIQIVLGPLILAGWGLSAWKASEGRRFHNKRLRAMWDGCQDRMRRFEEVLKKMRRDQVADLNEMPRTIRQVSESLYFALRRADIISHEIMQSEKDMLGQPPVWKPDHHTDPQSQELFRLADKNIAEYRQQYAGVMAGVQRTEAQSAVFMTTLDTLRMKMLGYRLVGRSPELPAQDFLEALAEARLQLESIDTALEELDLGHYPKTISVVQTTPPPVPDEIQQRLNNGS
jgi:hypothetical protein